MKLFFIPYKQALQAVSMTLLFIVLLAPVVATGQNDKPKALQSGIFTRKSVTMIPLSLERGKYDELLRATQNGMLAAGSRLDYNLVATGLLRKAQEQFVSARYFADNIDSASNEAALENALRASGALQAIIAQTANLDSLNARNARAQKRIVTSAARSAGVESVSAAQAHALVNGTFIGFPVLTAMESKDGAITAKGHIYWVQLEAPSWEQWKGDTPSPEQVKIKIVKRRIGRGSEEKVQETTSKALKTLGADVSEKNDALGNFVQELFSAAYSMDEFRLRGTVQQSDGGVRIDVGNREGASFDQAYKIYETRLDAQNKPYSEYMGVVRLDNLADTKSKFDALSGGYSIIPGGFDIGMTAVSHDQLIDVLLRPSFRTVSIPAKSVNGVLGKDVFSGDVQSSYNLNLSLLYNIAPLVKINQLYVGIDVGAGIMQTALLGSSGVFSSVNTPLALEASLVALKKFWFSRFAGSAELQVGLNRLRLSGKFFDQDWTLDYGTLSFAAGLNLGLEYAFSADLNVGAELGYRYALPVTTITYTLAGKEITYTQLDNLEAWKRLEIDNISLGGLRFGLRVSYSIPYF